MSLHALANHMAARGRGTDSTLVHMSPREVQGLQSLAMANGGTLTINPQTGLPEAGFLENLLPALAGFALNAFMPGVGGAVGGALGLAGTAAETVGTGLLVGGATGLATGSLEKGLMAGLGAYGGAGLESSLNASGKTALDSASSTGSSRGAFLPGAETSPAGTFDRLQAGVGSAMNAPRDFLKDNAWNFGLASAPLLAGTFDGQNSSAPKRNYGNIPLYKRDPATGKSYVYESIPGEEAYRAPGIVYGNADGGLIQHYDSGGITEDAVKKGIVWGNVGDVELPVQTPEYSMLSDSEKTQRYLMGEGPNPLLFYHKAPTVNPLEKAAEATKEMAKVVEEQQKRSGGNSSKAMDDSGGIASLANASPKSGWDTVTDLGLKAANSGIPGLTFLGDKMLSKAEEAKGNTALARNIVQDPMQRQQAAQIAADAQAARENEAIAQARASEQAIAEKTAADNATAAVAAQAQQDAADRAAQQAERQAAVERTVANENYGNEGRNYQSHDYSTHDPSGEAHDSHDARGGFLNHGKFDQRYAYGGGITALADGGMYNLGSYSDGGRLLRGPGDGVSDDIPATIGENQPARLADGEFVVPARIVSELGNGSTEAGARKLYAMMDRVQKSRSKTVGKDKVAANTRADKYLPA